LTHERISPSVLPPLYSKALPFLKYLIVGYPGIACFSASPIAIVASTLANFRGEASNALAALAHSGANVWQ
jgi:hypothetical protein